MTQNDRLGWVTLGVALVDPVFLAKIRPEMLPGEPGMLLAAMHQKSGQALCESLGLPGCSTSAEMLQEMVRRLELLEVDREITRVCTIVRHSQPGSLVRGNGLRTIQELGVKRAAVEEKRHGTVVNDQPINRAAGAAALPNTVQGAVGRDVQAGKPAAGQPAGVSHRAVQPPVPSREGNRPVGVPGGGHGRTQAGGGSRPGQKPPDRR